MTATLIVQNGCSVSCNGDVSKPVVSAHQLNVIYIYIYTEPRTATSPSQLLSQHERGLRFISALQQLQSECPLLIPSPAEFRRPTRRSYLFRSVKDMVECGTARVSRVGLGVPTDSCRLLLTLGFGCKKLAQWFCSTPSQDQFEADLIYLF